MSTKTNKTTKSANQATAKTNTKTVEVNGITFTKREMPTSNTALPFRELAEQPEGMSIDAISVKGNEFTDEHKKDVNSARTSAAQMGVKLGVFFPTRTIKEIGHTKLVIFRGKDRPAKVPANSKATA